MTTENSKKIAVSSSGNDGSELQVRIAMNPREKDEIYRLRYEVYAEEMSKPLGSIVYKRKQIFDPLDDSSILLYVQTGDDIIATARLTIAPIEEYTSELAKIFRLDKFSALLNDHPNPRFGLGTKLAIKKQYRSSPALYQIITEFYQILHKENVPFWFGGCNPYLIPLYERMGFRRFAPNFTDPGYGLLVPIVIVIEDVEHFRAVKSPLYRHARKTVRESDIPHRFLQAFPETAQHLNTRLITPRLLWEHAEQKLGANPMKIRVFKNLSEDTAMDFLFSGVMFSCTAGDCIVHQGYRCEDLYILLSGSLIAETTTTARILHPGDHFGSLMQNGESVQTEGITSLNNSELIVIPRQAFERYQHMSPATAKLIVNNLKCLESLTFISHSTEQGGFKNA